MMAQLSPVIPEEVVLIDNRGTIAYVSNALETFFAALCIEILQVERIIGSSYLDLWDRILPEGHYKKNLLMHLNRLVAREVKNLLIEIPGCSRDGPRDIFLNTLRIPGLNETYVPIQHIDVTELLAGEQGLKKRLKKLQRIIDNHSEFVCLMGPDRRLTFVNEPLCAHLSTTYEGLQDQPFENILPHNNVREEFLEKIQKISRDKGSFVIEYIVATTDPAQEPRWLQWHIKTLFDQDDRIAGFHATGREISSTNKEEALLEKERALIKMAYNDPVTGLANRMLFIDRLNQLIIRAKRYRIKFGLIYLDLNNFKKVNDSLGYDMGDRLLKAVSLRIAPCVRDSDIVSRIGGDDFAIVLSEIDRSENAVIAAQRIIKAMSSPFSLQGNIIYLTISLGIAVYPDDGVAPEVLLKNAETAMYYAKAQETNSYQFFNPTMNQYALERLNVESDLRRAIEKGEFVLHFQPQISIHSGTIVGAEALVRWLHPEKGLIAPGKFIPIAEETGLIIPMSELIIKQAIEQAVKWSEMGLPLLTVAVNISVKHFRQANFAEFVLDTIHDSKFEASALELELTESILMHDVQGVINTLNRFRGYGIQVSIDDFGTGYSSLSYLKNLPISKLKIDQSFVRNITVDTKDAMIVKTIIEIAHNLGLKVIAEGVEHLEQVNFLTALKCDELQGYFYSKPLSAHEFRDLVEGMLML